MIKIHPVKALKLMGTIIYLLAFLSLTGQFSKYYLDHGNAFGFVPEFYLDNEQNIPTFFSCLLLLTAAFLLVIITVLKTQTHDTFRFRWGALAVLFVYVALDEAFSYHERINEPLKHLYSFSGLLYYAWVVPAIVFLLILVVVYFKFFVHLPQSSKLLFSLSAATYIGGAVGVEMIGGWCEELYGYYSFLYAIISTMEETLELTGTAVFIYALLKYIAENVTGTISFKMQT